MSKFSRTVILTAIALIIVPQPAHAGWMRTYGGPKGDGGKWMEITEDSCYVICGGTMVTEPHTTVLGYLIKTNQQGDTLWTRAYAPSEEAPTGQFYCIQQTSDKGYIMIGYALAIGPSVSDYLWLVKTDSVGDTLWTRWYGGNENDYGCFVRQTTDGGYIITGCTESFGGGKNLWILKTNSEGDTSWTRTLSGTDEEEGFCVRQVAPTKYVIAGKRDGQYAWLLQLGNSGTLWSQTYGNGGAFARNVQQTSDGGYILTGANGNGVYLVKTDSQGNEEWSRTYTANLENIGYCVEQTADGGYVLIAWKNYNRFNSCKSCNGWLLKTDSTGDTLWTRTFAWTPSGHNSLWAVHQTADGGYIIVGKTGTSDAPTAYDVWLVKTDSLGFVGIEEIDNPPVVEVATTVDTHVTLYYTDHPNGFHANVYDASGQKVDEIHNASASGTIEWGQGQQAGVYFIRVESGSSPSVQKVVLVK